MRKATLHVGGLIDGDSATVEGWLTGATWNGHVAPSMTADQLDVLISKQDPALSSDEVDKVFKDPVHGYAIVNSDGDCEKLDLMPIKTPDGEDLYFVGNCWTWDEAIYKA